MGGERMSRVALIGVTTSEVRCVDKPTEQGEPRQREMTLGLQYMHAVERAGGLPVVLPPLHADAIDPLLDRLDGICLSGGPDLDPDAYHAVADPHLGPTWPELDAFELELARRADARGLPVLGICRGAQALNVARGGTLHQHLPDITDGSIRHRQHEPARRSTHQIKIDRRSLIGATLRDGMTAVNSFHHQAVDTLGAGVRAVAFAPDGVVEAIEATDHPHWRGVQWHAETLVHRGAHLALFTGLVHAAARV
jgi:putative glutamine amidotransferase